MKKIRENRKLIKGVGPLLLRIKKIVNSKLSVYRLYCGLVTRLLSPMGIQR
ncbi:uncharacterized protein METZ01_LOCUS136522 [marine metagenome]|uniref:Uncharacterized protein n=1 Tax=marine metagenome TaxID=408172 RepID=A0A381Z306_9ZZZZ